MDSTVRTVWNPSGNSMESISHSMDSIWINPGRVKYWRNGPSDTLHSEQQLVILKAG